MSAIYIDKLKNTPIGNLARREYWIYHGKKMLRKYSDYEYIKMIYEKMGIPLNLHNPLRYTEKLQWLKLFWRDDLATLCSDKYSVRKYITDKGYDYLLNDLLYVYDSVDEFELSKLPEQFVLKATHGSGWNYIVKDKSDVNWAIAKLTMRSWLRQNLYVIGREWNYRDIKPRIVAEKYLEDDSGALRDYKFYCMNGEPKYVHINEVIDGVKKRVYLDSSGKTLCFKEDDGVEAFTYQGFGTKERKMLTIARDLSEPFPFVRVDFYECAERIYFGELTFFDSSGFFRFEPDEWDFYWGGSLNYLNPTIISSCMTR